MTDTTPTPSQNDVRPVVGRPASNRGVWLFAVLLAISAGGLFGLLEARRTSITSPATSIPAEAQGRLIAAPPPLVIPQFDGSAPEAAGSVLPQGGSALARPAVVPVVVQPQPPPAFRVQDPGPSHPMPPPGYGEQFPAPAPFPERPGPGRADAEAKTTRPSEGEEERAYASRFIRPAVTVPKGTIIQAVLETALNSNHPGYARAVVSRDISSFDGSRVLIPKGSKLFGEYKADINQGQNRALIRWHRLTRPDGTIIDVDSPTADPLGRAGVKGKVNSHFFARFGGAILQSALDLGVQIAARKASRDTYVFGIPYGLREANPIKPEEIRPTLKVRQGTSVSVFVARDLDFSEVE